MMHTRMQIATLSFIQLRGESCIDFHLVLQYDSPHPLLFVTFPYLLTKSIVFKKKKYKRRQFASSKNCLNCLTNHPPDIKTSWRRSNDFSLSVRPSDVAGTSQVKHPTTSRWNVTKTFQSYISKTCYWNVVTTSQKDLTTKSHQYVSTTSQKSLK